MYNEPSFHTTPSPRTTNALKHALLVDDVTCNLEILAEFLRPLGFEATYATDIAEARKALAYAPFDVVFLDCELPDGFGDSFAAEISGIMLENSPVIISMTASDDREMEQRCYTAGAKAFIHKPITFELVCESLRKCKLLDIYKQYQQSPQTESKFKNIHFMAQGDGERLVYYLKRLAAELETELIALIRTCRLGEPDAARTIVHRILSLTPLIESRQFTSVIQACQRVARLHDIPMLQKIGKAIEWEYRPVKISLQNEIARNQSEHPPLLCRSA